MGRAKDRYNEDAYARYTLRIRKDSGLYNEVEKFMSLNGASLNYVVTELLKEYFEKER